jgi:hypothetical protein
MWIFAAAYAAEPEAAPPAPAPLVIDAKVPVELLLQGNTLGELYVPGTVTFLVPPGSGVLRVYVGGSATDVPLQFVSGQETRVIVGRTGISTEAGPQTVASTDPQRVEFRLTGGTPASVRVDATSHRIDATRGWVVELPPGAHALSLRSSDGTAIWATGQLTLNGGAPLVVLVTEGRLPEVSGPGAFHPAGS